MNSVGLTVASLVAIGALEGVGDKLGGLALSSLQRLTALVRRRLSNTEDLKSLDDATSETASTAAIVNLAATIDVHLDQDTAFSAAISRELRLLGCDKDAAQFLTRIESGASVNKIVNIGQVGGDISF